MIAQIINPKKTGRNEPCPCGKLDDAGKPVKYKKCCMVKKSKRLSQRGFHACFQKLVMDAGGKIDISCEDLEAMPKDEALGMGYNAEEDSFHFEVVKVKMSPIITPDKRLRTG